MNKNIINVGSIMIAAVFFLLLMITVNGQSAQKAGVFKEISQNVAYQPPMAFNQDNIKLLPAILSDFEDVDGSCEYLEDFPNVCVVLT